MHKHQSSLCSSIQISGTEVTNNVTEQCLVKIARNIVILLESTTVDSSCDLF